MKKSILFSFVVMAALVACYKDEAVINEIPQDPLTKSKDYLSGDERVKMKRHKITTERALLIAQEAKGLFADETERMIRTRSIGTTLAPVAITTQARTRAAGGVDTLMYVVNYSNNGGFVFVSNDDRDGEILMYSGGGNFAMQDTAGNEGLKMHVEMMLAYQEHKLNEIREVEARGEEYKGTMTTDEVSIDECLPNILTTSTKASGMPGMPGHTCNVPGQPGMPGTAGARKDICAPKLKDINTKYWFGNEYAISQAKKNYSNEKCFGIPIPPPVINFPEKGTIGHDPVTCSFVGQYCYPHIYNYSDYYDHYGCRMEFNTKYTKEVVPTVGPLLKTYWDQDIPLRVNNGKNSAGCGPLALMQMMAYHNFPETYTSPSSGRTQKTFFDKLRILKTNDDIEASGFAELAREIVSLIGVRLGAVYKLDGATSVPGLGTERIQDAFKMFGYSIGYEGAWDYHRDQNFWRVVESIQNHLPVYIQGFHRGPLGGLQNGHIWVLDGYKKIFTHADSDYYLFDRQGVFNGVEGAYFSEYTLEFIHANMGWGDDYEDTWVQRGVYVFASKNYDGKLYYIAGIQPQR